MTFGSEKMPADIDDVLKRWFLPMPALDREALFGTRGVLSSFWRSQNAVMVFIGTHSFMQDLTRSARKFGAPVPGIAFSDKPPRQTVGFVIPDSRLVGFQKLTLDAGSGQPITLVGSGSVALVDMTIVGRGVKSEIQIGFVGLLNETMTMIDFKNDIESFLVRTSQPTIKQVPLHAAA